MFYGLTNEELEGRRPLAKFLSIKLIVMFTFYQSFIVSQNLIFIFIFLLITFQNIPFLIQFKALQKRVIKGTILECICQAFLNYRDHL